MNTNPWIVIEHDDTGSINQVIAKPTREEAIQTAQAIATKYFEEPDPEDESTLEEALREIEKLGEWKGFSFAVTVIQAVSDRWMVNSY